MKKKKQNKIFNDILLSIRYSRLKEELKDTEDIVDQLNLQRKIVGTNDKKILKSKSFIESVEDAIHKIEQNNQSNKYKLYQDGKLNEQLNLLSKSSNFKLLKYFIALGTVLDTEFDFSDNTRFDFIDKISKVLFDDEKVMRVMQSDYKKISSEIKGTKKYDTFDTVVQNTKKVLKNKHSTTAMMKIAGGISVKSLLITSSIGITLAGITVTTNFYLKRQAKKMVAFGSELFANKLIVNAINLKYARIYSESAQGYRIYFKNTLKEINYERNIIMKQMFEDRMELEKNKSRIRFLQNFDNYIINQMNFKERI